jgi:hypothetical protein
MNRPNTILAITIVTFLLCFNSCDSAKHDATEVRRARVEAAAADKDDSEKRAEVVAAAREFIVRTFPDWKVNGISSYHYGENYYLVAGDISKGDERRTVDTSVRLYVDDNEHTYWKVEHTPDEGEQRLPGYDIRPYKQ